MYFAITQALPCCAVSTASNWHCRFVRCLHACINHGQLSNAEVLSYADSPAKSLEGRITVQSTPHQNSNAQSQLKAGRIKMIKQSTLQLNDEAENQTSIRVQSHCDEAGLCE